MNIYETYIKFETALLAKSKGFTLRTLGSHTYNYYKDDGRNGCVSWGHLHLDNAAIAPQHLLQRWLRDEHGIYIELLVDGWDDNICHRIFIWEKGKAKPEPHDDYGAYGKYEDALEFALQQALNLIEC